MKTSLKSTLIALSLLAISGVASAADSQPTKSVEDYTYATKLDIAKVISGPNLDYCGVQAVEMTYQDHSGKTHTLRYDEFGNGCNMG